MRIGVVGSREFDNYALLSETLSPFLKTVTLLVSGGAKGADSLGKQWADENGIPVVIYKPDWDNYGKVAGFRRNSEIVSNSDCIIAFWDGESRGTADTIKKAKISGLNVIVINYNEENQWII